MANLPTVAPLGVTDVDASTLAATKYNLAAATPTWFTVGDTTPTGISGIHMHKHTGANMGHQLFRPQPGIGTDKMLACTDIVYQFMVPFDGPTAATGTVQCTVLPTITGDTIRIGPVAYTYRFVTALAQAYDVLISTAGSAAENRANTMRNLVRAITGHPGGSGSDYHAATPVHPTVTATNWANSPAGPPTYLETATITSRLGGVLGNSQQLVFDGSVGDGTFVVSGATLTGGGGQNLARGSSYYLSSLWQGSASRGYRDDAHAIRLVGWTYTAPALPTVIDGGNATETVQLEIMYGAATSFATLTVQGSPDALGRTQYSSNGGGSDIPAGNNVWARVPTPINATWQAPPGALWTLYFAMVI